ncbi:M23 family metallopeptidase [Nevskia sp.]|uniref:M23 family metallopeptidase n=1 Tax=Nevskia sp. TaxID=1929292 RepID=UPI0025EFF572|nr:M23 family metallopeptidase [Nevskia sp.]
MDIIVVSHSQGRTWRLRLEARRVWGWLPLAAVVIGVLGLTFVAGMNLQSDRGLLPKRIAGVWGAEFSQQRDELAQVKAKAEEDARALARRIAQLQAHVIRLDAAGTRMTQIANIDPSEFSFDRPPAVGGPETEAFGTPAVLEDVIGSLDRLQKTLGDRERQMRVLEDLLLASRLEREVKPSGWPIDSGYITSGYGSRTDPFTGLRTTHPGIDFAAAEGSQVHAVASGIVTEAATANGYGQLIEINHGNGYRTRYGHNSKLLVKIGDRVLKGQPIALIGSTGRSTGPHVHFELVMNGNVVNPGQYLDATR